MTEEIVYTELVENEVLLELVGIIKVLLVDDDLEEMVESEDKQDQELVLAAFTVYVNEVKVETLGEDNTLYLFQLVEVTMYVQTLAEVMVESEVVLLLHADKVETVEMVEFDEK